MNNEKQLDITSGKHDRYVPIKKEQKRLFTESLSSKHFPYENDNYPTDILSLMDKAYDNFEKVRKKINWTSEATIIIKSGNITLQISCNGEGIKKITEIKGDHYMIIELDPRLFKRLLTKQATWSDADLGSHLKYKRVGNIYKRGFFYCWNSFCV